jgi:hypothetical protein
MLYYNIMWLPSYMRSVVDRNVVMRRMNHPCTWTLLHVSSINRHPQGDIIQKNITCFGFACLLLENGDLSRQYVAGFMCVNESWFMYPTFYAFVCVRGLLQSQCTGRIILNLWFSWWIGKDTERNDHFIMYTMSEKDCTFLFFFLGAQCVESGVSCTDCY